MFATMSKLPKQIFTDAAWLRQQGLSEKWKYLLCGLVALNMEPVYT